jgi:hypothetical protein
MTYKWPELEKSYDRNKPYKFSWCWKLYLRLAEIVNSVCLYPRVVRRYRLRNPESHPRWAKILCYPEWERNNLHRALKEAATARFTKDNK